MIFNDDTRAKVKLKLTVDTDPTGQPVLLKVDDTWYPCTWIGSPVESIDDHGVHGWYQEASTDAFFKGPNVTAGQVGDILLTRGVHPTESKVGEIVRESNPIEVA